jgi:tetratricopeptide (TPR) repeat protein
MKKMLFVVLSLLFATGLTFGQDAKKAEKDAERGLSAFNLDQSKSEKLTEAIDASDIAIKDAEIGALAKTWITRGQIFNAALVRNAVIKQLEPGATFEFKGLETASLKSLEAFKKALSLAEKKFETKDAITGLSEVQPYLTNSGVGAFEEQNFGLAYMHFKAGLDLHQLLLDNGAASIITTDDDYDYLVYLSGLAAMSANMMAEAEEHYGALYSKKYDNGIVYEAMYKIYSEKEGIESAYRFLQEGRKAFPDDVSLLFAEINHYLKIEALDKLIENLKEAIAKEPSNISLYTTTGSVFDNLYQRSYKDESGDRVKGDEYFQQALSYYNQALELDPTYTDAIYSIGVLFYNHAAFLAQELNVLADDMSKEGLKKYDQKKEELLAQFDKALPWFIKAEQTEPNDLNVLIALKEIYAKKDELELSTEFKNRLETVQGGGSVTSYFKGKN